jgi:hypothetical protein
MTARRSPFRTCVSIPIDRAKRLAGGTAFDEV